MVHHLMPNLVSPRLRKCGKERDDVRGTHDSSDCVYGGGASLSKEEVERALKDIKEQYAPVTYNGGDAERQNNTQNRSKARGRLLEAVPDSLNESSQTEDA